MDRARSIHTVAVGSFQSDRKNPESVPAYYSGLIGVSGIEAQVTLLRELSALFLGNELSSGGNVKPFS
jgi:hypothetical protein